MCYNDKKCVCGEETNGNNKKKTPYNVEFTNQKGTNKIFVVFFFFCVRVILVLPYFIYALKRGSACGFLASPFLRWLGSCCWLPLITSNGARRPDQLYCTAPFTFTRDIHKALGMSGSRYAVSALGMRSVRLRMKGGGIKNDEHYVGNFGQSVECVPHGYECRWVSASSTSHQLNSRRI